MEAAGCRFPARIPKESYTVGTVLFCYNLFPIADGCTASSPSCLPTCHPAAPLVLWLRTCCNRHTGPSTKVAGWAGSASRGVCWAVLSAAGDYSSHIFMFCFCSTNWRWGKWGEERAEFNENSLLPGLPIARKGPELAAPSASLGSCCVQPLSSSLRR